MHRLKKTAVVCIAFILVGTLYAGYKLERSRRSLEWYKEAYGYRTPTEGLKDCVFESPAWKGMLIDAGIAHTDGAHNLKPYDIDGDGTLELIGNSYRSDTLLLYEPRKIACPCKPGGWVCEMVDPRVGGGIPTRPMSAHAKAALKRFILGTCTEGAHYTAVGDLTGDNRPDMVVAGDLTRYDVVWYEAIPGAQQALTWKKHVAYQNDAHRTYHVETGDIDGDGDRDIVFATKTDHGLGWLENQGGLGRWPAVMVDSNCVRCFYSRVADVDNDGRGEILASEDDEQTGGKLHLYKYAGNPQSADNWRKHEITHCVPGHGISVFVVVDVDHDGDLDVAAANHGGDVFVLRNPGLRGVLDPWDRYCVNGRCAGADRDFREIDAGDLDCDGDQDIVVADECRNAVVWFENPGEVFCEEWTERVVDRSPVYLRWCHSVKLGDIDADGDLDIAVAAAGSNVFLVYLNQMASAGGNRPVAVSSDDRTVGQIEERENQ